MAHVSHTAQPGGAELALTRLLRDAPWQAAVCAPDAGDAFDHLAQQGIKVDRSMAPLPIGGTRKKSPLLAAKYLAALRRGAQSLAASQPFREAEVVHANTAAAAILCALAAKGRSVPLIVHLRDAVNAESLGRFGYEAFTRIALPRCDAVIANSRFTADSARGLTASRVPIEVIQSPSGVTRKVTAPTVRETVTSVVMVGRLMRWKGQHVFLRAFAEAFGGTEVKAYLAGAPLFGEAAYEAELRQLAGDLGIARQVVFLGHVSDVARLLESADIVVHASTREEPLGQTVIQGLAAAKPVVATEGGGPGELISSGVNGLLVPREDPAAMAAALRALAGSWQLRARLAAAAGQSESLLTDDECVAAHAAFFHKVRWA